MMKTEDASRREAEKQNEKNGKGASEQAACEWSNPDVKVDETMKRCTRMFNCYEPPEPSAAELKNDHQAVAFSPQKLMAIVRKHMDSADYLKATTSAVLSPAEASRALVGELSGMLDLRDHALESKKAAAQACAHKWKAAPRAVFRNPLWTGKCQTWLGKDFKTHKLPSGRDFNFNEVRVVFVVESMTRTAFDNKRVFHLVHTHTHTQHASLMHLSSYLFCVHLTHIVSLPNLLYLTRRLQSFVPMFAQCLVSAAC